jgi:hypothetical protein
MKALRGAVHVLHSLSSSTLLGEAIGLVRDIRRRSRMFLVSNPCSLVVPASESSVRGLRYPTWCE